MKTIQSILVLAYPNAGEQDLLIPWERFKALAWRMTQRSFAFRPARHPSARQPSSEDPATRPAQGPAYGTCATAGLVPSL